MGGFWSSDKIILTIESFDKMEDPDKTVKIIKPGKTDEINNINNLNKIDNGSLSH